MKLYDLRIVNERFIQTPLETVPASILQTSIRLRDYLLTQAVRRIGGHEGRDFRIKQSSLRGANCLVPLYVSAVDNSCSLVIE